MLNRFQHDSLFGSPENVRDKFSDFLCENPINKIQIPKQKRFGHWELELVWDLEFVVWDFRCLPRKHQSVGDLQAGRKESAG